jgi:hypothetical protein
MIAKQDNNRRDAATALASITAGLLATALAIYTQTDPYAFTSETLSVTDDDVPVAQPVSLHPQFLPRVEGTAVTDRVSVAPGRRHSLPRSTELRPKPEPSCVPYWRELDSGPVGRHVLVTCPGAQNPPPPPVSLLRDSRSERLPSLATLSGSLPEQQLPASLLPSPDRARLAARDVDSTLTRRWRRIESDSADEGGEPAALPLANPLSWAPAGGPVS